MMKKKPNFNLFFIIVLISIFIFSGNLSCASLNLMKISSFLTLKKEEIKVITVINNFFTAAEELNFTKQKTLSKKYVLDYVTLAEFKYYFKISKNDRTVEKSPARILEVNGENAIGTINFVENFKKANGFKYKITSGKKVYLKKIDGVWKIIDYEIDGRLVSDILYVIHDDYESQRNIVIGVNKFYIFRH